MSNLFFEPPSIEQAEQNVKSMLVAARKGDLRLAVSRGITAVVRASRATVGKNGSIARRAAAVVMAVRQIAQSAALSRMARMSGIGTLGVVRSKEIEPGITKVLTEMMEESSNPKKKSPPRKFSPFPEEVGQRGGPVFIRTETPWTVMDELITGRIITNPKTKKSKAFSVPLQSMKMVPGGIIISAASAKRAQPLVDMYWTIGEAVGLSASGF